MSTFKKGDWLCASCQFHNFRSRKTCHKCNASISSKTFFEEVSGKSMKSVMKERNEKLEQEINKIKKQILTVKDEHILKTSVGSVDAKKALIEEGFIVERNYTFGCNYDDPECWCSLCASNTKRYYWIIKW